MNQPKQPPRLELLASPVFVVSVALLVVNDFVLKATFHNGLTGKLSDFAGLAAFSLFGCALWPGRERIIALAVSVDFILWKSPYSQTLIDGINLFSPFPLSRTVDYTDLMALPVVWLACHFAPQWRGG